MGGVKNSWSRDAEETLQVEPEVVEFEGANQLGLEKFHQALLVDPIPIRSLDESQSFIVILTDTRMLPIRKELTSPLFRT